MEYTVQKLAKIAGVSARTLRFYDEIGLLKPARVSSAGYRIYGAREVDQLQQILILRALGLELSAIADILHNPDYNRLSALRSHLHALRAKQAQLALLIENVSHTIEAEEGKRTMTDTEKFDAFKARKLEENEAKYGEEIRAKYGAETVEASNSKWMGMQKEQYDQMQALSQEILDRLGQAVRGGDSPSGETGREIALLHKQWLSLTWPEYKKEAHLGLVQMYIDDERFTAYYDGSQPGNAQFLRDAVHAWAGSL